MPPDCRQKGFRNALIPKPFLNDYKMGNGFKSLSGGGRNNNHKFLHTHNQAYWFCKLHLQQLQD